MEILLALITTALFTLQFSAGQHYNARYTFATLPDSTIIVMDSQTGRMLQCTSVEHCHQKINSELK